VDYILNLSINSFIDLQPTTKYVGYPTVMPGGQLFRQVRSAFSDVLLRHLLSRTIRIEEDLVDQLFNSSEKRLAEIVGTTRSRVSFFMNRFRKMGFIQYTGQHTDGLEVRSSLLNVILHN
jgi:CRP/FNR family cyclic AMP-dependent transcriptional regulator